MVCVQCGQKTAVINSRHQKRANNVWRRRQCLACGTIFTTEEIPTYEAAWAVQGRSGSFTPFSRDKLLLSIYKSCEHRKTPLEDAQGLVDTVMTKLLPYIVGSRLSGDDIKQITLVVLNRFDRASAVHYQALHSR